MRTPRRDPDFPVALLPVVRAWCRDPDVLADPAQEVQGRIWTLRRDVFPGRQLKAGQRVVACWGDLTFTARVHEVSSTSDVIWLDQPSAATGRPGSLLAQQYGLPAAPPGRPGPARLGTVAVRPAQDPALPVTEPALRAPRERSVPRVVPATSSGPSDEVAGPRSGPTPEAMAPAVPHAVGQAFRHLVRRRVRDRALMRTVVEHLSLMPRMQREAVLPDEVWHRLLQAARRLPEPLDGADDAVSG